MVLASFDFGITWDEDGRHRNGQRVLQFLLGHLSRSSFAETGGHLYPGLFDTSCAALERWVPADRYALRHAVNATFGWVGVLYCGRLAARFFGWWPGSLALLLLALSPRYFADSMNNPKDVPFAAMSVMALYYISTLSPRWPYVSLSTGIKIAVSLALALNIRVGALVYLGYFGLLTAAFVLAERCTSWRRLADTAGRVLAITVAVLFLGTVFWPWAGAAPLTRPFQALLGASDYPWRGTVLFIGQDYFASELPWYYAPWWFLISTPPVVLGGVALSMSFTSSRDDVLRRIALSTAIVLPVAATIVMGSTLYDGIRHLQFITPILVVLATAGWAGVLRAPHPWLRRAAAAGLAAGLATVLAFDIRFHPNQGVYFNELVGGPQEAYGRYDMDYWGNCMLEAVEWAAETARAHGTVITVSGDPPHLVQFNSEGFPELRYTHPSLGRHYLEIELARGTAAALRRLATESALYQVTTPDGALLCSVTRGPRFGELGAVRHPPASGGPNRQAIPK